jgi:ubiquinone/menaquinone biosynthesis C-methylase UbiE
MKQFRFKVIERYIPQIPELQILDIGSGSHSPVLTKQWKHDCKYTAVDINQNYNNDEQDIKMMDKFIQMDLTSLKFDAIPDNSYDIIFMSHIIEHLHNGDEVLKGLLPKLNSGGVIYIEFPSARSIRFPSMKETLNFFDDSTHCRIFSLKEVCNLLMGQNYKVLIAGTRRDKLNILLIPVKVIHNLLTRGYIRAGTLWDLYGFADYVVGTKKN